MSGSPKGPLSPPQELEVGGHRPPYLLFFFKYFLNWTQPGNPVSLFIETQFPRNPQPGLDNPHPRFSLELCTGLKHGQFFFPPKLIWSCWREKLHWGGGLAPTPGAACPWLARCWSCASVWLGLGLAWSWDCWDVPQGMCHSDPGYSGLFVLTAAVHEGVLGGLD